MSSNYEREIASFEEQNNQLKLDQSRLDKFKIDSIKRKAMSLVGAVAFGVMSTMGAGMPKAEAQYSQQSQYTQFQRISSNINGVANRYCQISYNLNLDGNVQENGSFNCGHSSVYNGNGYAGGNVNGNYNGNNQGGGISGNINGGRSGNGNEFNSNMNDACSTVFAGRTITKRQGANSRSVYINNSEYGNYEGIPACYGNVTVYR
jgi:hypothetical protein